MDTSVAHTSVLHSHTLDQLRLWGTVCCLLFLFPPWALLCHWMASLATLSQVCPSCGARTLPAPCSPLLVSLLSHHVAFVFSTLY